MTTTLPFTPLSFRDFMLFEDHVTAASRGIARRYMPTASRIAATTSSGVSSRART